jgi:RNA polymerase sigma factor (sigma-70 family)
LAPFRHCKATLERIVPLGAALCSSGARIQPNLIRALADDRRAHGKDMQAPEEAEVIARLSPAVSSIAKRLVVGKWGVDASDLAQCGLMRILDSLRAGTTGTDWFLLQRSAWSMRKALARELARAAVEVVSLDDPGTDPKMEPAVLEDPLAEDDRPLWRTVVSCLTPRERQIVAAIHQRNLTQQQTATALGISQPRVHQIYRQALVKLRISFGM